MRLIKTCSSVLAVCLLASSCSWRFAKVEEPLRRERYLEQIARYNHRLYQLRAIVDIKAYGFLGHFFRERADLVVQTPSSILWSLRSFFGPPSMILAFDGEYLTTMDFSGQRHAPYQRVRMTGDSLMEYFDFVIHPQSLIDIFLGRIPLDGATSIEMSKKGDRLQVLADLNGGWRGKSIFDLKSDRALEIELDNRSHGLSYKAVYRRYEFYDSLAFPKELMISARIRGRSSKLVIDVVELQLNGELVPKDVFRPMPNRSRRDGP